MKDDLARSNHAVIIRSATADGARALAALIVQLAIHHGDQATTDESKVRSDLFTSSPWAIALVAELAGKLLGYALLVRLYSAQSATRGMDLHHLFVVPEARGSGVGKALVRAARAEAETEGCAQLVVGTQADNHRAQAFYRKVGFEDARTGGPKFRLQLGAGMQG